MIQASLFYDFQLQLCAQEARSSAENPIPSGSLNPKEWEVVYTGYGRSEFSNGSLTLEPKASTQKEETHAALALNRFSQQCPVRDFILEAKASTEQALRLPQANPWEALWIFFNYRPVGREKENNYFILKPNGTEVGRAYGEIGQDFLFSNEDPTLALGRSNHYRIEKWEGHFAVYIDGKDLQIPDDVGLQLYAHPGAIGFYTEDARVRIDSAVLEILDARSCDPAAAR